MLKKLHRLPGGIRLLNPKTLSSAYFVLKTANNQLLRPRFGIIISKKTAPKATDRNSMKRLVASCLAENITKFQSGYDYLCVIRRNISTMDTLTVRQDLLGLFRKGGYCV